MKKYQNKKLLTQLYISEKKSTIEIGKIFKCSDVIIGTWLKKYDIPIRTQSETRAISFAQRFWKKIDINESDKCWNWTAYCSKGYGVIQKNGLIRPAHVVAFELYHCQQVKDNHVIHHICNNKKCCNPMHLQELTNFQHKSLHSQGEKCNLAKLTDKQVLEIRTKYEICNYSQQQLAKEYGVVRRTIGYIVNRRNWRHI